MNARDQSTSSSNSISRIIDWATSKSQNYKDEYIQNENRIAHQ